MCKPASSSLTEKSNTSSGVSRLLRGWAAAYVAQYEFLLHGSGTVDSSARLRFPDVAGPISSLWRPRLANPFQ
jgi:hypothetical protein